jgi:hypothetical protein
MRSAKSWPVLLPSALYSSLPYRPRALLRKYMINVRPDTISIQPMAACRCHIFTDRPLISIPFWVSVSSTAAIGAVARHPATIMAGIIPAAEVTPVAEGIPAAVVAPELAARMALIDSGRGTAKATLDFRANCEDCSAGCRRAV